MRRGESKAKGPGQGRRTLTGAAKAKTRARRKGGSAAKSAKKLAANSRVLNKAAQPSVAANDKEDIAALRRALTEAHQREAATTEVLKVISSSPGEIELV